MISGRICYGDWVEKIYEGNLWKKKGKFLFKDRISYFLYIEYKKQLLMII